MSRLFRHSLFGCLLCAFIACKPKGAPDLLQTHQALGAVLAEEAATAAGSKKQIVLLLPNAAWGPSSETEKSFTAALKQRGISIALLKAVDVGDPMRAGPLGLKAGDFLEVLEKSGEVGAIVSLAGAPLLRPGEGEGRAHAPVLVVATSQLGSVAGLPGDRMQLARLLDAKILQVVIIDQDAEATPAQQTSGDATHQTFGAHFRILRARD